MKKRILRLLSLTVTVVMLFNILPVFETQGILSALIASSQAAQVNRQERIWQDMTPLMQLLEDDTADLVEWLDTASAQTESDYTFAETAEGTAVILAYHGASRSLKLPMTLGGMDVVALASGALPESVTKVTVHGNVKYIAPDAMADRASVYGWQGTYALSWATREGHAAYNMTDGLLREGVVDFGDVTDRVKVASYTQVLMGRTEAERIKAGSLFVAYGRNGVPFALKAVSTRASGDKVYVSCEEASIADTIVNMRVSGNAKLTADDFDGAPSVSADETAEGVRVTYTDRAVYTVPGKDIESPTISGSLKPPKSAHIPVSFKFSITYTTNTTAAYMAEVTNGEVVSGSMTKDQTDLPARAGIRQARLLDDHPGDPVQHTTGRHCGRHAGKLYGLLCDGRCDGGTVAGARMALRVPDLHL